MGALRCFGIGKTEGREGMTLVDIMKNIRKQVESKSKVTISSDNGWILLDEIDRLTARAEKAEADNKRLRETYIG